VARFVGSVQAMKGHVMGFERSGLSEDFAGSRDCPLFDHHRDAPEHWLATMIEERTIPAAREILRESATLEPITWPFIACTLPTKRAT